MEKPNPGNALITGSSRGIGRAITLALAQTGYNIAINYLKNEDAAIKVQKEVSHFGIKSRIFQADVRKADSVEQLISSVEREFGGLEILINNVGDFIQKSLSDLSVVEWNNMLASNLSSVFYCCKSVLEGMKQRNFGRIINIALAGVSHIQAYQKITAYAIAKTGVLILTKSLAIETAKYGITVNAISPGHIKKEDVADNLIQNRYLEQIPAGHLGSAEDVANAVLYLVGDKAKYVTGTNIIVSGGWGI